MEAIMHTDGGVQLRLMFLSRKVSQGKRILEQQALFLEELMLI